MEYRVLGAVEPVDGDGIPRPIGSRNQRTVLAALLAHRGRALSIDALVDAVWGDDAPPSAVTSLRTYVSRLRAGLGDELSSRGNGFVLDVPAAAVDAGRFDTWVDEARDAPPAAAAALLERALELWRGAAYADRADGVLVRAEARRLEERRTAAAEARAGALLAAARVDDAVAAAEALVTAEPLREGGWTVLVQALAAAGRPAEALRAYRRAADALAEAGLEPSAALRAAERAVLVPAAGPSGSAPEPAPVVAAPAAPAGVAPVPPLPLAASSFVGRAEDRDRVADLLGRARLVTLVGPGGVGKTRLALEVAGAAAAAGPAVVVELATVDDPGAVADQIVAGLGLPADGREPVDALRRAGHLELLVVLDNAEHVVGAVAAATEALLSGGPSLRLLVTSRERLGVDGEHVWTVAPLDTTGPDAPACSLFVERVRAAVSDLDLAVDDPLVVDLVQRLDGLPLAIEMAAAHLATSSLAELRQALETDVDLLRSPRRLASARHRSLAAVLGWSEARAADGEARTLRELSVFAGPVAAAELTAVLERPAAAEEVRALAERSLAKVERRPDGVRFSLLQTVRAHAARRLAETGDAPTVARRHAEWYTSASADADARLRTVDEAAAHAWFDDRFDEIRAAHGYAVRHDLGLARRLSAHLNLFAHTRLVDEPLRWAEELLAGADPTDPHLPAVLASAAARAVERGQLALARERASRAVELAGPNSAPFAALEVLGDASLFDGRIDESAAAYRQLADRAAGRDPYFEAVGVTGVVLTRIYAGVGVDDVDLAAMATPDRSPSALGWVAYCRGERLADLDPRAALWFYDEAFRLARAVGNRYIEGVAMVSACALHSRAGDEAQAARAFVEAIGHWRRLAATTHQLTTLRNLAVLLRRLDAPESAAELLGFLDRADVPTYGDEARRLSDVRSWAAERLGTARLTELAADGRRRDEPAAVAWALATLASLAPGAVAAEPDRRH